jgi:hypothetical protein
LIFARIVKKHILVGFFRFFQKILAWARLVNVEWFLPHTGVNTKMISLLLSQCCNKFSHMLSEWSNFDNFFIDIWPKAQPAQNEFHCCLSQLENDFFTDWVNTEMILSLTESMRFFRWLNFPELSLQDWLRALTTSGNPVFELGVRHLWAPYCAHPVILSSQPLYLSFIIHAWIDILSSKTSISQFLTTPIQLFLLVICHSWAPYNVEYSKHYQLFANSQTSLSSLP